MNNELKPCPFCGNVNVVAEVDTINRRFAIYCVDPEESCLAEMNLYFSDAGFGKGERISFEEMGKAMQELTDKWNNRTEPKHRKSNNETKYYPPYLDRPKY